MSISLYSSSAPINFFGHPATPNNPGFSPGQFAVIGTGEYIGSDATPATPAGWTLLTDAVNAIQIAAFGRVMQVGDTIPQFDWGTAQQWAFMAVYSGVDPALTFAFASAGRQATDTTNIKGVSVTRTPSADGAVVGLLGQKNKTTATDSVAFSGPAHFSFVQGLVVPGVRVAVQYWHWIQSVATALAANSTSIIGNLGDATAQSCESQLFALLPAAVNPIQPGDSPVWFPPRPQAKAVHEFWQVAIELLTFIPPTPPPLLYDLSVPRGPRFPVDLRGYSQSMPSVLRNTDRVLQNLLWNYRFRQGLENMPAALRSDSQGLTILQIQALTNFPPYIEYNWMDPPGPQQWNRGFEYSIPLGLRGTDSLPTASVPYDLWLPPPGPRFPIENRTWLQSGPGLQTFVPIKPPLNIDYPNPLRALRNPQDMVAGIPLPIYARITTQPPFLGVLEIPPRGKPVPPDRGYTYSGIGLLNGNVVLPVGGHFAQDIPVRRTKRTNLFDINETSPFLPSAGPPNPPITGEGKHMGRVVLPAVFAGENVVLDQFDYLSGLAAGETLTAIHQGICTLYSGVDPNPQSVIVAIGVSGSKALVEVLPLLVGNVYVLRIAVSTSQQQVLILTGYLSIIPNAP